METKYSNQELSIDVQVCYVSSPLSLSKKPPKISTRGFLAIFGGRILIYNSDILTASLNGFGGSVSKYALDPN